MNFNVTEDLRFKSSLQDLGVKGHVDVLKAISRTVANNLSWTDFITRHGWVPRTWTGEHTAPGAIDLYDFVMLGPSGQMYQLTGSGGGSSNGGVVVCAVATIFRAASASAGALTGKSGI